MSGTAWDDTNRSLTMTGATVTTSKPILDLSQTWNAGAVTFTAAKINVTNTASAAGSLLMDLQVGGTSQFSVRKDGYIQMKGNGTNWSFDAGSITGNFTFGTLGTNYLTFDWAGNARLASIIIFGWSAVAGSANATDTGFARNAAGIVEVNNGTANTYRDLKLRNLLAGGGNGSYIQTPSMTVANLAAAATAGAGARAFVTDATATTFLSTVSGGGANKVPVVSDGSNWLIG